MSFSKNKENKPMKNYICPSRFRILVPSLCDLNLSPPYYIYQVKSISKFIHFYAMIYICKIQHAKVKLRFPQNVWNPYY